MEPGPAPGLTYRDLQRAILFGFTLYLVLHFADLLSTLLLFFLLVFILAAVLNPVVSALQRRGVSRILSTLALVSVGVLVLVGLGMLAVPPLVEEVGNFLGKLRNPPALGRYYQEVQQRAPWLAQQLPTPEQIMASISANMGGVVRQAGRYTVGLATAAFSLLLLLVLVVYTTASPTPLVAGLLAAVPERRRGTVERTLRRVLVQLRNWAFGSLTLGTIVGLMTGVGLWLVGTATGRPFPNILLFSVIAGVGEMVPNIGPILSAIPPALIALTIDPMLAVWVLLTFLVIQQLENNLIVPYVMGQSLNLHPVSLLFTVLVMGALFGLMGAVLAVPICAIIKICWEEFYLAPRGTDLQQVATIAEDIILNGSEPDPALPRANQESAPRA